MTAHVIHVLVLLGGKVHHVTMVRHQLNICSIHPFYKLKKTVPKFVYVQCSLIDVLCFSLCRPFVWFVWGILWWCLKTSSSVNNCDCFNSKFCYKPHGHIITGNLDIARHAELRKLLLKKGPKYRISSDIDFGFMQKRTSRWSA